MSMFNKVELLQLHKQYMATYDMYIDTVHSKLLIESRGQLLRRAELTDNECVKTACMFMLVYKDNVYDIDAVVNLEEGE